MTFPQQLPTQLCAKGRNLGFKTALTNLQVVFSLLLISLILPDFSTVGITASPLLQPSQLHSFTIATTTNRLYQPPQSGIPDRREGAGTR